MATDQSGSSEGDNCKVAIAAAMDVALNHCVDGDELTQNIGRIMGVAEDVDCETALETGVSAQTCADSEAIRQWVTCRAQEIMKSQQATFDVAMEEAWDEAHKKCDAEGEPL